MISIGFGRGRRKRHEAFVLAFVEPYTRKTDGKESFLLWWRDSSGNWFVSGLRGDNFSAQPSGPAGFKPARPSDRFRRKVSP